MFRLMSYNIGNGAADHVAAISKIVQNTKPNVLGLLETVGWNQTNRTSFSKTVGLPHVFFGKANTKYDMAFFGTYAPAATENIQKGFWHTVIRVVYRPASLGELAIFLVHLDPRGEDERLREIHQLITLMRPYRHVILAGDFNALSAYDPYNQQELLAALRTRNLAKFGTDTIRFDCINTLELHDFVDARKAVGAPFYPTVPTAINRDESHLAPLRLDYVFVSSTLVPFLSSSNVIRDEHTDSASDHYPVVADFSFDL